VSRARRFVCFVELLEDCLIKMSSFKSLRPGTENGSSEPYRYNTTELSWGNEKYKALLTSLNPCTRGATFLKFSSVFLCIDTANVTALSNNVATESPVFYKAQLNDRVDPRIGNGCAPNWPQRRLILPLSLPSFCHLSLIQLASCQNRNRSWRRLQ